MLLDGYRYFFPTRDFSSYFDNSPQLVLDIGCATGQNGKVLKDKLGCKVYGVEPRSEDAQEAAKVLDRVVASPFDANVLAELDDRPFDGVLLADVLEHLYDPWLALRQIQARLAPGGLVVASIPNVRNLALLHDIMIGGRFTYTAVGLLDATHIRFFTLKTMYELFDQAGLAVRSVVPNLDPALAGIYQAFGDQETPYRGVYGELEFTVDSKETLLELTTIQFTLVATAKA